MGRNFSTSDPASDQTTSQQLGGTLRAVSQVVGLILILAGAWYALSIIATGIKFARNPSDLEPDLVAMAKTLNLEKATVTLGEDKIAVDRTVASVVLLLWYLLSVAVAWLLVSAGGRLVLGVVSERREFLAAMKEFLISLRAEGGDQHCKSG